jgi:hypothetical protein
MPSPRSDFIDYIERWKISSPLASEPRSILSIRHPLDSFLSSRKKGWHRRLSKTGSLDQYCKSLLKFQNYFSRFSTKVRYEDLCHNYKEFLHGLAASLRITPYTASEEEIQMVNITGKSGRQTRDISPRPRNLSEVDTDLHAQAKQSSHYKEACKLYGYNPEIHAPPI